ncbi:MAG: M3 family oligoendopeptidase [Chitinophagales bacterium]
MKFNDFEYSRPDMSSFKADFEAAIQTFSEASELKAQDEAMSRINDLRSAFDSMNQIAAIRYTQDTTNEQYVVEQQFFDEQLPVFQELESKFYQALIDSRFKDALEEKWGKQLFDIAAAKVKTISPEVVEDLKRENQLASSYTKLLASAKILFEGKERNLQELTPFEQDLNRDMRKRASEAKWGFFEKNAGEIDRIFDELVKVRHLIATKLGYENYVPLAYNRLMRTDYDAKMVANYRQQVLEEVVPVAAELRQRQAKRLGLDSLAYYDTMLTFNTGNPTPKGNPDWIVENGKKMYADLSPETDEFFNFMLDNDLMDLVSRKGKATGGYCNFISNQKAPFIFSNFNGTSGDINVLTHEAGHAFQVYMSRNYSVPEYNWPTYEACEIHSMSMEFFAWPWMESFFKNDTEKFKFEHLNDSVLFLPYGVSIDEFQHFVYENPDASPKERKAAWRNIEKKYLPWMDYSENDFLEEGSFWYKQAHLFFTPFYYIDYTLAQVCAFQFWKRANDNREDAFADYVKLCKAGGSQSFLKLVEYANLNSPFEDGCIKEAMVPIKAYLETVDDMVL